MGTLLVNHFIGRKQPCSQAQSLKLHKILTNYLKNIRRPEVKTDRFFTTNKTGRVSNNYVNGCIRNAVIKLDWDKEISAHNLRHSFSSNLLEKESIRCKYSKVARSFKLGGNNRFIRQKQQKLLR
ncbi:MAG: tyrosine-type recombinase/integrase [Bacillota bacterium]|jgi:integrase/recombinase XerD